MSKDERRKEISEFAKRLAELAKMAPDGYARRDLYRSLYLMRKRYSISPEKKKLEILRHILDGVSTVAELLLDTGYTKNQVERGVQELIAEKKIREEKVRRNSGAGRPLRCFFPF